MGGPAMVKARSVSAFVSVAAIKDSLRIQGIAFHGPLRTPGQRVIFLVDGYVLLQSELLHLLKQNKLNRDGVQELAKGIQPPSP